MDTSVAELHLVQCDLGVTQLSEDLFEGMTQAWPPALLSERGLRADGRNKQRLARRE